jgi:hypothetical protein
VGLTSKQRWAGFIVLIVVTTLLLVGVIALFIGAISTSCCTGT